MDPNSALLRPCVRLHVEDDGQLDGCSCRPVFLVARAHAVSAVNSACMEGTAVLPVLGCLAVDQGTGEVEWVEPVRVVLSYPSLLGDALAPALGGPASAFTAFCSGEQFMNPLFA